MVRSEILERRDEIAKTPILQRIAARAAAGERVGLLVMSLGVKQTSCGGLSDV